MVTFATPVSTEGRTVTGPQFLIPRGPTEAIAAIAIAPPRCPRSLPGILQIARPSTPHTSIAALRAAREKVAIPSIVTHFFPGQWETRPAAARASRRDLMRWVIGLLRTANLFPVLDEDWIDEIEEEDGPNDADGEEPFYAWTIPAEGGHPYEWRGVVDTLGATACAAEALLYVICGNPTDDEEYEGNSVASATAHLRRALARPGLVRFSGRVHTLVRAALATSRRYLSGDTLSGFDHALVTDLGGVFARRDPPLAGVPTLARVMARSTGSCFLDVDGLGWSEMGYDSIPWSISNVQAFADEWAIGAATQAAAYPVTLHPLRDDPSLFGPLVAALRETLAHYRAHAFAHGQPDPVAYPRPMPARRHRLRRQRQRTQTWRTGP